jgi:hypothetical protein
LRRKVARRNAEISEDGGIPFRLGVALEDNILAEGLALLSKPGGIRISGVVGDEVCMLDLPVDDWVVDDEREAIGVGCLERPIRGLGPPSPASDPFAADPLFDYVPDAFSPAPRIGATIVSIRGAILWNPPGNMRVGRRERNETRSRPLRRISVPGQDHRPCRITVFSLRAPRSRHEAVSL